MTGRIAYTVTITHGSVDIGLCSKQPTPFTIPIFSHTYLAVECHHSSHAYNAHGVTASLSVVTCARNTNSEEKKKGYERQ